MPPKPILKKSLPVKSKEIKIEVDIEPEVVNLDSSKLEEQLEQEQPEKKTQIKITKKSI